MNNKTKKARVVVIGGPKGGTTKSTVAANLAVTAAESGLRACLIDCDCNGQEGNQSSKSLSDRREVYIEYCKRLLEGEDFKTLISEVEDRHLIAALKLFVKKKRKTLPAIWDSQLQNTSNSRMYQTISRIETDFDLIIVDTSGYSSPAFQSSAIVADLVLVPSSNSILEVERIPAVIEFLDQYEERINMNPDRDSDLVIDCRVLLSKVETHNLREVLELRNDIMKNGLNIGMCSSMIGYSRKFVDAAKWGLSPTELGAPSKFAAQFQMLLDEVFGKRDAYALRVSEATNDLTATES